MHIIQMAQEQHAIYFGYAFLGVLGKFYRNLKGLKDNLCPLKLIYRCICYFNRGKDDLSSLIVCHVLCNILNIPLSVLFIWKIEVILVDLKIKPPIGSSKSVS